MVLQLQAETSKKLNSKALKIGLMGSYGRSNLGDLATQKAMIQNIRKYNPDAKIYAFSLNAEDTERRFGIPSFPIHRGGETEEWWLAQEPNSLIMGLYKILQSLRSISNSWLKKISYPARVLVGLCLELNATIRAYQNLKKLDLDVLIIPGGGLLCDFWWGPKFHPYMVFLWSNLASLLGVKFALFSVGAGPIDAKLSKILIKKTLEKAFYRSYRDEDSKNYLKKVVGYDNDRDPVYPDLAHSLQIAKYSNSSSSLVQQQSQTVVGINLMVHEDPSNSLERTFYSNYVHKMAQFISWLIQQQYQICLFPGCIYGDRPVIKDVRKILEQNGVESYDGQIVEKPIYSVDDLMWQLSTTDLVVASRFHSVLLSLISNKPVLAVSYHRKIDMLMADTGQTDYCLSIENFDVDTLKARFTALEANRDKIKQQLDIRIQEYRSQLDKQYEAFFSSI